MATFLFAMGIVLMVALPTIHHWYLENNKGVQKRVARHHAELFGFGYTIVAGAALIGILH
ncbi:MAG: hypothetical protein FJY38_04700 [Betaproteobacteria bacterium]|jgi:hypothetical protein|nr:hypothetical protein [Betaproteobacteria bacterium]